MPGRFPSVRITEVQNSTERFLGEDLCDCAEAAETLRNDEATNDTLGVLVSVFVVVLSTSIP